jgi:hypothetical protein
VITTMNADNVVHAVSKLYALAGETFVPAVAQAMIADSLAGVLHQKINGGARRKLEAEFLFLRDAQSARSVIRSGKFDMLDADIRRQMNFMIAENAAAQRHTVT